MTLWMRLWARWRGGRQAARDVVQPSNTISSGRTCSNCCRFRNDPIDLEAAVPGLASLSSGFASVRSDDGLCLEHDRFVTAGASCPKFYHRLTRNRSPDLAC